MGIIESKLLRLRIRFKPKQYGSLAPVDDYYGDRFGLIDAYHEDTYEDVYMGRTSSIYCYEDDSDIERAPRPIYINAGSGRICERWE